MDTKDDAYEFMERMFENCLTVRFNEPEKKCEPDPVNRVIPESVCFDGFDWDKDSENAYSRPL